MEKFNDPPSIEGLSDSSLKVQEFIKRIDADDCTKEELDQAFTNNTIDRDDHHFLTSLLSSAFSKDDLTRLEKRNFFKSKLDGFCKEVDEALPLDRIAREGAIRSVMVIVADMDSFKEINDQFGHNVGDEAIKKVAERLKEVIRSEDVVARTGGDEFSLALPIRGETPPEIEEIKEKIRSNLSIEGPAGKINLEISIGYTIRGPGEGTFFKELMEVADDSMYRDKSLRKRRRAGIR